MKALVRHTFEKRSSDELSIWEGETIIVVGIPDDCEWNYGVSTDEKRHGWFPASYVDIKKEGTRRAFAFKRDQINAERDLSAPSSPTSSFSTLRPQSQSQSSLEALIQMNEKSSSRPFTLPRRPTTEISSSSSSSSLGVRASASGRRRSTIEFVNTAPASEAERWKDKVTPERYEALPERERLRQEVIYELIRTESEYIRDLGIIIDVTLSLYYFSFSFLFF